MSKLLCQVCESEATEKVAQENIPVCKRHYISYVAEANAPWRPFYGRLRAAHDAEGNRYKDE